MMTKQKGFVAALLMTTAFTPMRTDAACTPTPDCAELGYTQTLDDCPDGAIKCPWDSSKVYCCGSCKCSEIFQYTCTNANEIATGDYCGSKYTKCNCASGYKWENGSCKHCEIGDIFYSDYNCSSAVNYDSTKEVLGIVVYVNPDGIGGQIMTPWPIDANGNKSASDVGMPWGPRTDIPGLPNYDTRETAMKDYNSCSNTDIIVKQENTRYSAAWVAREYAPNEATKGKWCLPAAGIMTNIYNNQKAIQTAISKVGGVTYPDLSTWSSSEYNTNLAWISHLNSTYGLNDGRTKNLTGYVRPVLEF